MKTKLSIIRFWLSVNYNQIFVIFVLIFFTAQIMRLIITNVF